MIPFLPTLATTPQCRGVLQQLRGRLGLTSIERDERSSFERRMDWAISQHPEAAPWLQVVVAYAGMGLSGLLPDWKPRFRLRIEPLIPQLAAWLSGPFSHEDLDSESARYKMGVDAWYESGETNPIDWDWVDDWSREGTIEDDMSAPSFSANGRVDGAAIEPSEIRVDLRSRLDSMVIAHFECGDEWIEIAWLPRSQRPLEFAEVRFGDGGRDGKWTPLEDVLSEMNGGGTYMDDMETPHGCARWLAYPREPVGDVVSDKQGNGLSRLLEWASDENPDWDDEDNVDYARESLCKVLLFASAIHWVKVRNLLLRRIGDELPGIADWYLDEHPNLANHSLSSAVEGAHRMHLDIIREEDERLIQGSVEEAQPVEIRDRDVILASWPDGAKLVELRDPRSFTGEGMSMAHCIGRAGYYDEMRAGNGRYVSYRMPPRARPEYTEDQEWGAPVATLELVRREDEGDGEDDWFVNQMHGHRNGSIAEGIATLRIAWWLHEQMKRGVVFSNLASETSGPCVDAGIVFDHEVTRHLRSMGDDTEATRRAVDACSQSTFWVKPEEPYVEAPAEVWAEYERQVEEMHRRRVEHKAERDRTLPVLVDSAVRELQQHSGTIETEF